MNDESMERDLRSMLHARSNEVPDALTVDERAVRGARARRRTKLAAIGSAASALALVVGIAVLADRDQDRGVDLQPAESTTPDATSRVVGAGAIVAVRADDHALVELAADGSLVRVLADVADLVDDGTDVVELDAHPDGIAVYVRVASDRAACGTVTRVDLNTDERERIGGAAGVAISADGTILALSADLTTDTLACGEGGARSIVAMDLRSGWSDVVAVAPDARPDVAREPALSADGSHVAFEACWEGCEVRLAEVPLTCIAGTAVCDRSVPTWDQLPTLAATGGAVEQPEYVGAALVAAECDCEVEAPDPVWRAVAFDPASGARSAELSPLTADLHTLAVGDGTIVELAGDGTLLVHAPDGPEPRSIGVDLEAVAIVPGAASVPAAPDTTIVAPTTSVPSDDVVLAAGALVAARPDGTIVELDVVGNVVRDLYDVGRPIAELDVVAGGRELYVRLRSDDELCTEVRHIDLIAGSSEVVGIASSVAVSDDGRVLALSAELDDAGRFVCNGTAQAVVVTGSGAGASALELPMASTSTDGLPLPDYARRVALSGDGGRLVFEQCWEGCATRLVEVPVECIDGTAECDLQAPTPWNEMIALAHDGSGYGAGAYLATFADGVIVAAVCDCEVDAPTSAYRLESFDLTSGALLDRLRDLPDVPTALGVAGDTAFVGYGETTIVRYTDEPVTLPGAYATFTIAP